MQSFSPPASDRRPRLLVLELWGIGDVALAVPFLSLAARHARVTLVAKAGAAALVQRFCPEIELIPFTAPWTALHGKYRFHRWPWLELSALLDGLGERRFAAAISARPDPRDHALMAASGAEMRAGFPRAGSALLLTDPLSPPANPHRAAHWEALATHFGWKIPPAVNRKSKAVNQIIIHTGAAQPTRQWARERFDEIAVRLRAGGWQVIELDENSGPLDHLIGTLATADFFIGNDSGPGHLAALLGVPTFTIFGAQVPELFHPVHPQAAWIEGAPCPFKPCNDYCRFAEPHCIRSLSVDQVWRHLERRLAQPSVSTER